MGPMRAACSFASGLAAALDRTFRVQADIYGSLALTGLGHATDRAVLLGLSGNEPATIDPGYRGEIKVILLNLGREVYHVHRGDKIAQLVIARYEQVEWEEGGLNSTERGAGGFGSSGR